MNIDTVEQRLGDPRGVALDLLRDTRARLGSVANPHGQGFAAYAQGVITQSIRNRCAYAGHSLEVQLAGMTVNTGDLMMGDINGILVIPEAQAEMVLHIAQKFADTEERVKNAISQGVEPIEAHKQVNYDRMT